jgi:antibiotic biosynthesis monooxygenase (ABM) superfamily enzyme
MPTDNQEIDNKRSGTATPQGSAEGLPHPDEVTSVIQHRVQVGAQAQYEAWLQAITPAAQHFPGHQGVNIIRPSVGEDVYTIVLHFDTLEHLQGWLGSETRRRLSAEIQPLLASDECVEIKTGLEFWFTPPTPRQRHPPPYKQFLLTLSVIFPLTVLVPWALRPLFHIAPALGLPVVSNFVIAAVIVGLATYVIMPRYTRLLAGWLYGPPHG